MGKGKHMQGASGKVRPSEKSGVRNQWHPGFCGAVELELSENRDDLYFEQEHYLGKQPVRPDLLILKKKPGAVIKNEIGRMFRDFNVLDYKSPGDSRNIDSFFKAAGYACLYKGLGERAEEIPDSELTLSLLQCFYPRKLMKQLKQRGAKIEKKFDGIYYVTGYMPFATQVIVTSQLDKETHVFLRMLSNRVTEGDIRRFAADAQKRTSPGDEHNVGAVMQVSVTANWEIFDRIKEGKFMYCEALRDLFQDELEEKRKEGRKEGRKEERISLLVALVNDKLINLSEAARRMDMTEEEFRKLMAEKQ